jgi:hypothetical protein
MKDLLVAVAILLVACIIFWLGRQSTAKWIALDRLSSGRFSAIIRQDDILDDPAIGIGASEESAIGDLIIKNRDRFEFFRILYGEPGTHSYYLTRDRAAAAALVEKNKAQARRARETQR